MYLVFCQFFDLDRCSSVSSGLLSAEQSLLNQSLLHCSVVSPYSKYSSISKYKRLVS